MFSNYLSSVFALTFTAISAASLLAQAPGVTSIADTRDGQIYAGWDRSTGWETSPRPVVNDNGTVMLSASIARYNWQQIYLKTATPGVIYPVNDQTYGDWGIWMSWSYAITNDDRLIWLNNDTGDRRIGSTSIFSINNPTFYHDTAGDTTLSGRSIGANNTGLITYRYGASVYVYDSGNVGDPAALREVGTTGLGNFTGSRNINDLGQVVYGTNSGEIFYHNWNANTTEQLELREGLEASYNIQPSINNAGQIAFFGSDDLGQGLYLMDIDDPEGSLQLVDMLAGTSVHSISINDYGQILYIDSTAYDDYSLKLWTGSKVLTILSLNDEFLGGIVENIDVSSYALNNHGEVVFGYSLNDGNGLLSQGIGYYTIPEPSVGFILISGGILLLVAKRRRAHC